MRYFTLSYIIRVGVLTILISWVLAAYSFGIAFVWSSGTYRYVDLDHRVTDFQPKNVGFVPYAANPAVTVQSGATHDGMPPLEFTDSDDRVTHTTGADNRERSVGRTTEYLMTVQGCVNKYDVFRTVDTDPDDGVDYGKPMFFQQISGDATDGPGPDGHCAPREFLNEGEVDTSIVMPDGTRLSGVKFQTRPHRTSNGSAVCGVIESDPSGNCRPGESVCWDPDQ